MKSKVQKHNAKKSSLNQQFENIFRENSVKREHYHGGKFKGVNCICILEKAQDIAVGTESSPGSVDRCLVAKVAGARAIIMDSTCR